MAKVYMATMPRTRKVQATDENGKVIERLEEYQAHCLFVDHPTPGTVRLRTTVDGVRLRSLTEVQAQRVKVRPFFKEPTSNSQVHCVDGPAAVAEIIDADAELGGVIFFAARVDGVLVARGSLEYPADLRS